MKKASWRFRHAVRLLKALVFVPPEKVVEGFNTVIAYMDKNLAEMCQIDSDAVSKLDKFLKYVER